ncbi:MAG: hypothetical protein AAGF98_10550 [Cyanobacteria bacterium P01_H01_bin.153]
MNHSRLQSRSHSQPLTNRRHLVSHHQTRSLQEAAADFAQPQRSVPPRSPQVHHQHSQGQYQPATQQIRSNVGAPHPNQYPRQFPRQSTAATPRRSLRSHSPRPRTRRRSPLRAWLTRGGVVAGSSVLALTAVAAGPRPFVDRAANGTSEQAICQEVVQGKSVLSRSELSQLLAVAERAPKADVRAVIAEPYCTLGNVEVREGVMAHREAYPLEFNPETWFIVLYEGEEYAGFDFSFSR